jgi:hypothetical protein
MREAVEETYENLNSAQGNEYLSYGNEEALGDPPTSTWRERSESPMGNGALSETPPLEKPDPSPSRSPSVDSINVADDPIRPPSRQLDVPTLAQCRDTVLVQLVIHYV